MKTAAGFFFLTIALPVAAAPPALDEARLRFLKGNYAEARELYAGLIQQPGLRIAATIGLSRVEQSEGNDERALGVIDEALKQSPNAELHARRAELLFAGGKHRQAQAAVEAALKENESNFAARWTRSRLLLDEGKYDEADAECRWFVRTYVDRDRAKQYVKDPNELLLVALAGADNARWHRLSDQFKFILNEVIGDALKADKNFWPAECLAGNLLLEKFNKAEAIAAFDKALAINPRAADALVGKGQLALQLFELADADAYAERALAVNPHHRNALLLRADVAWAAGDGPSALAILEPLRATGDEAVLARISAASRDFKLAPTNSKPARFHFQRGKWLDDRRLYAAARTDYEKAIALAPELTPARTELGLLVLRMGEEDEARKLIADAFKADPFHVRLSNALKVLKHLEKYQTIRTEHFIVRFDPKTNAALGRLLADYLERDFEQLAKQFNYRPAGPFVAEAFTTHEMFSGRIITGPDLHTVGATTGRVLALTAPRAAGLPKPYNWARVVKHELTHIFNLDQSGFLVPHWLTEGLAVGNEGFDRPAEWLRVLATAAANKELFAITYLDRGFTHPRSPNEWTLAYCQAQLAVEYLTKTYGPDVSIRLLQQFRAGQRTEEALPEVCRVDLHTIESGYARYVRELVAKSGARPQEAPMSLGRIELALERDPDNPEMNARAAEQYLRRKRTREAREHANAALAKAPQNGRAKRVIAQLYLESSEEAKALEVLTAATEGNAPDLGCLHALARLQIHAGQPEEAVAACERGIKLDPANPEWLADLARAAKQAGDFAKAVRAQADYLKSDPDDLEGRRDLARTLIELDRFAESENYAREAIEIDPADDTAAELLLTALSKQSKRAEVERWKKLLGKPS